MYFYNKNVEVDFYIPGESLGIQVCYDLNDEQTLHREAEALVKMKKAFGLNQMLMVSRDDERTLDYSGEEIKVVPVWKWLLQDVISLA